MKRFWIIAICIFLVAPQAQALVVERLVTNFTDFDDDPVFPTANVEGTLRTLLHASCNEAGDDLIRFDTINMDKFPVMRIFLVKPLVIPEDCHGTVAIDGKPLPGTKNPEIVLMGTHLTGGGHAPGDLCMLDIYADHNTIAALSFMGNKNGAAICVFGRDNGIEDNHLSTEQGGQVSPNRYDIVISGAHQALHSQMTASQNRIVSNQSGSAMMHAFWIEGQGNTVSANTIFSAGESGAVLQGAGHKFRKNTVFGSANHGLVLAGTNMEISGNVIVANGGCPAPSEKLPSQPPGCMASSDRGGAGIHVTNPAKDATVGGEEFEDGNTIQYNMGGGVILEDSEKIAAINITHNSISKNYNGGIGIDLKNDGFSPNDLDDLDNGPNKMRNTAEHFQLFPLSGPGERYWGWGLVFGATAVEIAAVAQEDIDRAVTFGGGDRWIADFNVVGHGFEWMPESPKIERNTMVTTLVHDAVHNTSEYGLNVWAKPDADLDGIPDELEVASNPKETDTDLDGLPDAVEDRNRNGVCDWGETCADDPDTDKDGLSDWAETKGDGHYDPAMDSNPLMADTDGDGLKDGAEDMNNNGIWEGHLGETSPLLKDSDLDGIPDGKDSCKMTPNPQQEPWFCL